MSFILTKSGMSPDIKCPHCGTTYEVEWDTEYGDPLYGTETTECWECEMEFKFSAEIKYDSWA